MSDPIIATYKKDVHGPADVLKEAHDALVQVAGRVHDDVLAIVAKNLLERGELTRSIVQSIVTDRDPVARAIKQAISQGAPELALKPNPFKP